MGSKVSVEEYTPGPDQHPTRAINGGTRKAAEALMLQEWHYFFQNTLRWRNLRKITIGQVARRRVRRRADAAVGVRPHRVRSDTHASPTSSAPGSGMCGIEYFAHPWEFGPAQGQGAAADRRLASTSTRPTRSGWSARCSRPTARRPDRRVRPTHRRAADDDRAAHQGVRQPDGRQHGLLQRAQRLLHAARAQPLALGRRSTTTTTPSPRRTPASRTGATLPRSCTRSRTRSGPSSARAAARSETPGGPTGRPSGDPALVACVVRPPEILDGSSPNRPC